MAKLCRRYIYNNVTGREADIVTELLEMGENSPDDEMRIRLGRGSTASATPKAMATACQVDILYLIGVLIHLEGLGFVEHVQTWVEDPEGPGSISIHKWYIRKFIL